MRTSILIPYFNGDEYRYRNVVGVIEFCLNHIDSDTEVVLVEQNSVSDFSQFKENIQFRYIKQITGS